MSGIQPSGGVGPNATQNTIANPTLAAGCDNLWYAARCNPRLDPFAMNAMISEIINAVNGCGCGTGGGTFTGLAYDCNRLDNLCRAIRNHITQYLFDCCLPENFPDVGDACSIEQLVLSTDANGCRKIARYTATSGQLGVATGCSVQAPGTTELIPADPGNPASFYNRAQLSADVAADTVDETRLGNTLMGVLNINVACDNTSVELTHDIQPINFSPAANGGNGATSYIVLRIDGEFLLSPDNSVVPVFGFSNFETQTSGSYVTSFDAGAHTIEWFLIAQGGALPPAQVTRGCGTGGFASGQIYRALRAFGV